MAKFIWDKAKKKAVPESEFVPEPYIEKKSVDENKGKVAKTEKAEQGE